MSNAPRPEVIAVSLISARLHSATELGATAELFRGHHPGLFRAPAELCMMRMATFSTECRFHFARRGEVANAHVSPPVLGACVDRRLRTTMLFV